MSDVAEDARVLADLDEDARNAVFDALQARMPQVWTSMRRDDPRESVVIVPSMTLDRVVGGSSGMSQSLEERFLFFLLLLRQPRLRMVYVTSQPINPLIVDYYLSLASGRHPEPCQVPARTCLRRRLRPRATHREGALAPPGDRPDPRADPGPLAVPPRPVHDDDART